MIPRALALAGLCAWGTAACAGASSSARAGADAAAVADPSPAPPAADVEYVPSAPEVVRAMVDLANVGPSDVVYDLGCGDGRIVIEAARRGARGVGVEIDPALVKEARANARAAAVEDRVRIVEGDLYDADVRDATVVMLFLQPEVNLRLRPRLLAQLRPGARVVSHWHDMGDWAPDRAVSITAPARGGVMRARNIYLWTVRGAAR